MYEFVSRLKTPFVPVLGFPEQGNKRKKKKTSHNNDSYNGKSKSE
jgi:hypothetical protein